MSNQLKIDALIHERDRVIVERNKIVNELNKQVDEIDEALIMLTNNPTWEPRINRKWYRFLADAEDKIKNNK